MKLIKANIQNFKDIDAKEINFGGRSMAVIGKNGSGKSSLLQAISSPMNSKVIPLEPVKEGEEHAKVELEISGDINGEPKYFSIEMFFTPSQKKGKVIAYDAEGQKLASQKRAVEDLIGAISFDIFEFARKGLTSSGTVSKAGVKEQVETLMSFLSDEEKQKLSEYDHKIDELKEERKSKNHKRKDLEYEIEQSEITEEEIKKYTEKKDEKPIHDQIQNVDKEIERYQYVENQVKELEKEKDELIGDLGDISEEVEGIIIKYLTKRAKLKGGLPPYRLLGGDILANAIDTAEIEYYGEDHREEGVEEKIKKGNTWLKEKNKPSSSGLHQQLQEIQEWNQKVDEVQKLKQQYEALREIKERINSIDEEVKRAEQQKKEVFANSSLPVDGLEFDEEQVLYNGLPFNENQLPTSEIIKVGASIGVAMNKNLKMLMVRDGSLLDHDSLQELIKICEEKDHQLLIEMVGEGEMDVKFTEELIDDKEKGE